MPHRANHDETAREPEHATEREETISVALTSVAAVATAWAAFQSATWGGVQTFEMARANVARQRAMEARLEGDQQMHMDADLFLAFTEAYASGHARHASFLLKSFPPRLDKAAHAWLATDPLGKANGPVHPLAMPEYKIEAHERAKTGNAVADTALHESAEANRISEAYVMGTVILATVILFASIGTRLRARSARRAMMIMSVVALVVVGGWLVASPRAWPEVHF